MALGTTYNNNKKSSSSELTVYSALKMSNTQSEVDKTSLSFILWNNMLGIRMCPLKVDPNGGVTYDQENDVCIYLSPYKAAILANEIRRFINGECKNVGVNSRTGIINITDGSEYGISNPCITLRKIDEDGTITTSYAYEIRTGYHCAIHNFTENRNGAPTYEQAFDYDYLELEMIIIQLEEYVHAMSMGMAYSCAQADSRRNNRIEYKLNKIGEATHANFGNSEGSSRGSFFDTNNAVNKNNNLAGVSSGSSSDDDFE